MIKDPVCGMAINPQHAVVNIMYKGQMVYFCSIMCKTIFEREPRKYVKSGEVESEQGKSLLLLSGGKTWRNKLMK